MGVADNKQTTKQNEFNEASHGTKVSHGVVVAEVAMTSGARASSANATSRSEVLATSATTSDLLQLITSRIGIASETSVAGRPSGAT